MDNTQHMCHLHPCLQVLHGADRDIIWLQRDHGLYIVNMFDTGQAMRLLPYQRLSLAHLLKCVFKLDVDKTHQLSDWRVRPLPDDMRLYAQADTHFLLDAYDALRSDSLVANTAGHRLCVCVCVVYVCVCLCVCCVCLCVCVCCVVFVCVVFVCVVCVCVCLSLSIAVGVLTRIAVPRIVPFC